LTETPLPAQVLKEVFKDGDTAYVTFSTGPETFTVDWPGCHRQGGQLQKTADGGPARPHADAWLDGLDVAAFTHTGATHHAPDAADCSATVALLRKHSGALTAVFLYACGAADVSLGWQSPSSPALKGSSFRNAMQDAKVITDKMPSQLIDACFRIALAGGGPLDVDEAAAAGGTDSVADGVHNAAPAAAAAAPVMRMSLVQFAGALVLVATTRCVQGADNTPAVAGSHVSASRWVATAVEKLIVNSLLAFLGARVTRSIQLMTLMPPNADVAAVQTSRRFHLLALLARIPRSRPSSDTPQCSVACLAAFLHKNEIVLQAAPPAGSAAAAATTTPVVPNSKLTQAALGAMHRHHPDVTSFPAIRMPLALDADGLESVLLALAALHTSDGEAATLAQALTTLLVRCMPLRCSSSLKALMPCLPRWPPGHMLRTAGRCDSVIAILPRASCHDSLRCGIKTRASPCEPAAVINRPILSDALTWTRHWSYSWPRLPCSCSPTTPSHAQLRGVCL
jgi:hypothetical protein